MLIDYHLHLWPHGTKSTPVQPELLRAYSRHAAAAGVEEIAITEHLFRFEEAKAAVGAFWEDVEDKTAGRALQEYWEEHQGASLGQYVDAVEEAKAAGMRIKLGLEVDYYPGRMGEVKDLLSAYPFDVLLGSVHWLDGWMFDYLESPAQMARWEHESPGGAWEEYVCALEGLAGSGVCDVVAHPDLAKVAGRRPEDPEPFWDRITSAIAGAGMVAEVSSAGLSKPAGEVYPAPGLLARFAGAGIALTMASDAHGLDRVASGVPGLEAVMRSCGYSEIATFDHRSAVMVPLGSPHHRGTAPGGG